MSERSYVEGVPLRLGKRFYPLPIPVFKEIDIHIPDSFQEDYDFKVERQALETHKKWEEENNAKLEKEAELKRIREEEEKKAHEELMKLREKEQQQQQVEEQAKCDNDQVNDVKTGSTAVPEENPNVIPYNNTITHLQHESISQEVQNATIPIIPVNSYSISGSSKTPLQYPSYANTGGGMYYQHQPSTSSAQFVGNNLNPSGNHPMFTNASTNTTTNQSSSSISQTSQSNNKWVPPSNKIMNYSDFEPDTANPFDNAELKSINEMAELASVLQIQKNNSSSSPIPQHQHHQPMPLESSSKTSINVNLINGSVLSSSCPPLHTTHSLSNQATSTTRLPLLNSTSSGNYSYYPTNPNEESYANSLWSNPHQPQPQPGYSHSSQNYHHHPPPPPPHNNSMPMPGTENNNDRQGQGQQPNSTNFKKLYFPLLTSLASLDRDRVRDRALLRNSGLSFVQQPSQPQLHHQPYQVPSNTNISNQQQQQQLPYPHPPN